MRAAGGWYHASDSIFHSRSVDSHDQVPARTARRCAASGLKMISASATLEILLGPTNWAQFRPFGPKRALQPARFRPFAPNGRLWGPTDHLCLIRGLARE